MDDFSFYLSYYGLILGLSVAQVASGFLNAIGARHKIRIGWLTPALAIFILLDITSFWLFAWAIRNSITMSWGLMFLGLLIAIVYFLASGLIFPRNIDEWPDLDVYYWKHKRWIIGGILIPNVISMIQTTIYHPARPDVLYLVTQGLYWVAVVLLLLSRRKGQDLILLAILVANYIANAFLPATSATI